MSRGISVPKAVLSSTMIAALVAIALLVSAAPALAVGAPAWNITAEALPTNFTPNGTGIPELEGSQATTNGNTVRLMVRNLGETPISAAVDPIRVLVSFQGNGLTPVGAECEHPAETCTQTFNGVLEPGQSLPIQVLVEAGESGSTGTATATVSGGQAAGRPLAPATVTEPLAVSSEPAGFGLDPGSLLAEFVNPYGAPETQAGTHPYNLSLGFKFNTMPVFVPNDNEYELAPIADVKDVAIELPTGAVGNPLAVGQCTTAVLEAAKCAGSSQVGAIHPTLFGGVRLERYALFNLAPDNGHTNELGFNTATGFSSHLPSDVRTGGDYGITSLAPGLPNFAGSVTSVEAQAWGVPADSSHTPERVLAGYRTGEGGNPSSLPPTPFLTMPSRCGVPLQFKIAVDAYLAPGRLLPDGEPDLSDPNWKQYTVTQPPLTGCEKLPFTPQLTLVPTTTEAAAPTGATAEVSVPQGEGLSDPQALATSTLQDTTVTLPKGMVINPSQANGLGVCLPSEDAIGTTAAPSCPGDSKVGTVEIETPVLAHALTGNVYVVKSNPPDLKLLIAASGEGVNAKFLGDVHLDQATGQLTTTFSGTPQQPFSHFRLAFDSGPRAPLVNPRRCGTYTTKAQLSSWSGKTVESDSSFQISGDGNGGPCAPPRFSPGFRAGTANPVAGAFSPFSLQLTRSDSEGEFASLSSVSLPPGLLASLRGTTYCPDSALTAADTSRTPGHTGAQELAAPSCPASSLIGTATVGAGAGPDPFYVDTGRVYLAGPYKGAPLSLAVSVPAVAGPFDLGNIVVRTALYVDPSSASLRAVSDPFPTILDGVPVQVRDIRVNVDRPHFTLNPTSCSPSQIAATVLSTEGQVAHVSQRFQAGECAALAFKPKLALSLKGPTKRAKHPALTATVTYPQQGAYANIAGAQVTLPHSAFLDQAHIGTVCTRVQFAAHACPPASVYGRATAVTPLLDQPLSGPVYLRSSSHKLPDLVADLNGQIEVTLDGKIDSGRGGGIRTSFQTVPDAPVSKFTLEMQGGKKGLLVNSENLCSPKAKTHAIASFAGQNGKVSDTTPVIANDCGGKGKGKKKGSAHR
jgi:hypothetical protein